MDNVKEGLVGLADDQWLKVLAGVDEDTGDGSFACVCKVGEQEEKITSKGGRSPGMAPPPGRLMLKSALVRTSRQLGLALK